MNTSLKSTGFGPPTCEISQKEIELKVKTRDLTGSALDWAVAKCEGADVGIISPGWVVKASYSVFGTRRLLCPLEEGGEFYSPSTIWEQGGPIIEREEIGVRRNAPCSAGREWEATPSILAKGAGGRWGYGPTPLIAAMRCLVASKLGNEIEVPDELLKD